MTLKEFRKPITNKINYLTSNNLDMSTGRDTGAKIRTSLEKKALKK